MERNSSYSPVRVERFRATRIWNTIVSALKQDMPLGRHRKGLEFFDNCFLGNEVVSWTFEYLKNNRSLLPGGQELTRQKVVLLMQKFMDQNIFYDLRGRSNDFKDSSSHLYTFSKENIAPVHTTTKASFNPRGSIVHINPPMKCATTIVKTTLLGLSHQKMRRESSSLAAT